MSERIILNQITDMNRISVDINQDYWFVFLLFLYIFFRLLIHPYFHLIFLIFFSDIFFIARFKGHGCKVIHHYYLFISLFQFIFSCIYFSIYLFIYIFINWSIYQFIYLFSLLFIHNPIFLKVDWSYLFPYSFT